MCAEQARLEAESGLSKHEVQKLVAWISCRKANMWPDQREWMWGERCGYRHTSDWETNDNWQRESRNASESV